SVTLLISCDFISSENSTHQNLSIVETKIDYTLVDVYPLFRVCNGCDTNTKQNLCFESVLVNHLEKNLNKNKISVDKKILETIIVDLLVDRNSNVTITHINSSPGILLAIPKLDSLLNQGIKQLPEIIQPALKRGIPVDVQFQLPIKIKQITN
ncbi:MAG: hypothetical protein J7K34_09410, partial [Flavobacteriaceae bacterium]|nr:hypothetical protein [Flavobacteriaceae bacterium]